MAREILLERVDESFGSGHFLNRSPKLNLLPELTAPTRHAAPCACFLGFLPKPCEHSMDSEVFQ